ncbi:hypothetical protein LEAN103870_06180 [Legionella anisa]|uniref:Type IV secretion protein Dot n=1 Tax=Legionella anisa TaxID=28082 RepID=A0AAX0WU11_9GAMM|nr:hypothetical protein [Legionella anisa]AWN75589.1 hypothetical protein DLD14_18070 [Legionella anisa]KTC76380.1 hypothetical protein Lani_0453 [Legionella anisa]MBN5935993.1 hypothetical protein [Legionella anisa]MCW8424217.1 hypothetical protein [Legionella anisa]MCW8446665.1 hypothetical protein [Legionella anisa]
MPSGTYSSVLERLQMRAPQSTSAHRNTQRGNAGLAVAQLTVQAGMQIASTTSPIPLIPIAFAQVLNSGHAVCREDTHPNEKMIQGLQTIFSAVILGLAITLMFHDERIVEEVMYLFQLLYSALLFVSWGGSEVSKEPSPTSTTNAIASHMLKGIIKSPVEHDEEKGEMSEHEEDLGTDEEMQLDKIKNKNS